MEGTPWEDHVGRGMTAAVGQIEDVPGLDEIVEKPGDTAAVTSTDMDSTCAFFERQMMEFHRPP